MEAGKTIKRDPPFFYGWWIVVACILGAAVSPATLINVPFSLFITELEAEFAWSRSEISFSLTIFIACLTVTLPVMGGLIDRLGVKRVAICSIIMYAAALASLYFLTSSIIHFYIAMAVISVAGVGAQSLTYIKVLSAWFDRRRGLVIGICMAGYGLGYIIVPILTRYLIDFYGWRVAYAGLALTAILIPLPVVLALIKNTPAELGLNPDGDKFKKEGVEILGVGKSLGQAVMTREFWILAATFALVSFSLNGIQSQIVPLLEGKGLQTATATLMLSAIGVGSFPGRVLAGYLMDKIFAPYIVMAFYSLSIFGIIFLINADGVSSYTIFFCAVAIGLSLGAENDALGYLTSRYFGLKFFGQVYSVLLSSYLLGAALGPFFVAYAYDLTGSYDRILLIGVCAIALSCFLLLFLRRYQSREEM